MVDLKRRATTTLRIKRIISSEKNFKRKDCLAEVQDEVQKLLEQEFVVEVPEEKVNHDTSLRSWRYYRRARNKVLAAEPIETSGEAARNTKVPLPILLAASSLASNGSAAKTLFRARL